MAAATLVATVSNYFVPRLPGAHALSRILTKTVFERSASVDIIRVSAGVTVTVESKQQAWTKQSLPQRYLCVGCHLKSDQLIRSLCLKGHVRARSSTRWQEASEFLCTKTPLFGESWATKNIAKKPGNALSYALLMSYFQNFAADTADFFRLISNIWFASDLLWFSVHITPPCPRLFLSAMTRFLEKGEFSDRLCRVVLYESCLRCS